MKKFVLDQILPETVTFLVCALSVVICSVGMVVLQQVSGIRIPEWISAFLCGTIYTHVYYQIKSK